MEGFFDTVPLWFGIPMYMLGCYRLGEFLGKAVVWILRKVR